VQAPRSSPRLLLLRTAAPEASRRTKVTQPPRHPPKPWQWPCNSGITARLSSREAAQSPLSNRRRQRVLRPLRTSAAAPCPRRVVGARLAPHGLPH
ncbi:uncharacterized protein METZ01_LOCUS488436, partial [marine metagenome]